MVDSTPVEPVAEERSYNQNVEVVLSLQKQNEFQSVSPNIQNNLISQTTQDPSNVVDEGISISILTPDEILAIKKQNPAEALRKL